MLSHPISQPVRLVSQLQFNVPFQHKYGYIRDKRSAVNLIVTLIAAIIFLNDMLIAF